MCRYYITDFVCGDHAVERLPCLLKQVDYPQFLLPCEYSEEGQIVPMLCGTCSRKVSAAASAMKTRQMGRDYGPKINSLIYRPVRRKPLPESAKVRREPVV